MTDIIADVPAVEAEAASETPASVVPARTDLTNLRHRPFLIVNSIRRVKKGVNTRVAGWGDFNDNWEIFETPSMSDRVSSRVMREATVIVDVMRSTCVKNRFGHVWNDEVAAAYLEKYQDIVKQGLDRWITLMAQKMAAQPHFARGNAPVVPDAAE